MAKKSDGKFRPRRTKPAGLALNSLMDVLTIILLFLLVNYSENTIEEEIPKNMDLPSVQTKSSAPLKDGLVVTIDRSGIKVGEHLLPIHAHEATLTRAFQSSGAERLKIKADKDLDYRVIDKILIGAAQAGLGNIDFIAMVEE